MHLFSYTTITIRSLFIQMENFFNNFTIKTKYGTMAVTVTPIVIFGSIYIAWAYTARAFKKPPQKVLSRSLSLGTLHGGKLAMERLLDYQHAVADAATLEAAEADLKDLLKEEQPDFKKLQRTVAKLEMSGKEADAVRILEKAVQNSRSLKKEHEAYELEMLLVELLIYKGDFQKVLGCKCLDEEISDARRPLYKAIVHIMLEHPRESAESCWKEFDELRRQFQWPPSSEDNQIYEAIKNFDEFEKIVRLLKSDILEKMKQDHKKNENEIEIEIEIRSDVKKLMAMILYGESQAHLQNSSVITIKTPLSSPFDPIQIPLFYYPSTYGEHKYALPTHRSSCSLPILFSDYSMVLKEIQDLCRNSSGFTPVLRYMQGNATTFGGNLSIQKRISFFDHSNDNVEVPCGFFNKFPILHSDRIAMENCNGVVVVSAIFNNYDKIRQPKGLGSKTLDVVCFFMFVDDITLKGFHYHQLISRKSNDYKIGAWRIIKVSSKNMYDNPEMNGAIPKYLLHRLFPNSKFSIWINAKLQLVVDPLLLIHTLVVLEKVDMAISKHPFFTHTMEEAMATARWKKWWNVDALQRQMETYCEHGLQPWSPDKLPYPSDVPDSSLIIRKHGMRSNLFSCLMFNELEAFNPRDQVAFAYVRDHMKPKLKLNMFADEVSEHIAVEYRHNLKRSGTGFIEEGWSSSRKTKRTRHDLFVNSSCCISCQKYFTKMWDETRD
ncbi:hypothetical protein Pint_09968 [Pistacia integerrima]|uniref:Uncharacterized protein n=1 Tax=Pistacia integerrima TaxID=434235 RepID=A0ACC0XN10_9ROSI|nr:hypothetical protein Pint_09968 [Pistacia integerrima]